MNSIIKDDSKRQKIWREKKNGKFNFTLLDRDKESTNTALIWHGNTERLEEEMLNSEELGHCQR